MKYLKLYEDIKIDFDDWDEEETDFIDYNDYIDKLIDKNMNIDVKDDKKRFIDFLRDNDIVWRDTGPEYAKLSSSDYGRTIKFGRYQLDSEDNELAWIRKGKIYIVWGGYTRQGGYISVDDLINKKPI